MSERRDEIASLYYRGDTVRFGAFRLSIHNEQPDLPLSPWYMHYPKEGEPGAELLPQLYKLIGDEFFEICEAQDPPIRPSRIAGLPKGAEPLGDALASHYNTYPHNLLKFAKIVHEDGSLEFGPPQGEYNEGDDLQAVEDHISGARNNKLFVAHARKSGFVVTKLLVVVDRQQGGPENMAAEGVEVLPIFTADSLLEYGLAEGHIRQSTFDEVQEYRVQNQFSLKSLKVPTGEQHLWWAIQDSNL